MNNSIITDVINTYFSNYMKLIEISYDNYMNCIENMFLFLGKNREVFDKNKNHSVDIFNAFMSGYEKAKIDFGVVIKEPSDIYF